MMDSGCRVGFGLDLVSLESNAIHLIGQECDGLLAIDD